MEKRERHYQSISHSKLINPPLALDFQATTPCAPEVVEAMAPFWNELWGNPSSRQHRLGLTASAAVQVARNQIADSLCVNPETIVFTSGATEANNLALLGHAREHGKGHLISVSTEHQAVLDPLTQLKKEGFRVTILQPSRDGLINCEQLKAAIEADTFLVSVMTANNEIGVLQPLSELSKLCRDFGLTLHSDAAQAFGHIPFAPDALGLDLASISAHKIYGPKGIGALFIKEGVKIQPLQWGGGQEKGQRAGTLPVPLIVGFAKAAQLAIEDLDKRTARLTKLRDKLWETLKKTIPGILLNGSLEKRLPNNLNITIPGVSGRRLHQILRRKIACSSGSACSNGSPSHVIQALGHSRIAAEASLRISLGRNTNENDINQAINIITETFNSLS